MVVLAILGVLTAEILNTLIESLVDLLEPEFNPIAKRVKRYCCCRGAFDCRFFGGHRYPGFLSNTFRSAIGLARVLRLSMEMVGGL